MGGRAVLTGPHQPDRNNPPAGTGIVFSRDARGVMIVDGVLPGSPAAQSGQLHKGDILVEVNGEDVFRKPVQLVGPMLIGTAGSELTLGFDRPLPDSSKQRVLVALTRAILPTASRRREAPAPRRPSLASSGGSGGPVI